MTNLEYKKLEDKLLRAIEYKSVEGVKEVLKLNIIDVNRVDVDRFHYKPLLIQAINVGSYDIVKVLLENFADVHKRFNAYFTHHMTSLMSACNKGNLQIVELLIKNGADIDATNSKKLSALDIAKELGFKDIVNLLEIHGAKMPF